MTIARCLLVACVCAFPMLMGCGGSEKKDDAAPAQAQAKPAGCACPGEGTTCACGQCKDGAGCVCGK